MGGFNFNEQNFINNNIFKFEERLNTQTSRFLEQSPSYVTYFNIIKIESMVDLGFSNIENLLGPESPLQYSEIKDFPIYGIDPIQLRLDDGEAGLDSSYEGEAIILPNTIKPTPHDFFILNYVGKDFIFMITSVDYDTIKSNNYYKCEFKVKYIHTDEVTRIRKQVSEGYTCINTNIGTQDKAIIQNDELEMLRQLQNIMNVISERFVMYFYKEKYNSFIFKNICGHYVYDRYQAMFIQKNGILNDRNDHMTIILNNEDETEECLFEYDQSIYRFFELKRPDLVKRCAFSVSNIQNMYSVFNYYNDISVLSVRFRRGEICYIHEPITTAINTGKMLNPPCDHKAEIQYNTNNQNRITITDKFVHDQCPFIKFNEIDRVLIDFMHNNIKSVSDININELNSLLYFEYNWENFIKIPLFIYVVRKLYCEFINKENI